MANGSWNRVSTRLSPTSELCEADAVEQHVQRDQKGRVRDHQDREREQEQHVLAGEVEPGEGVAAEAETPTRERRP